MIIALQPAFSRFKIIVSSRGRPETGNSALGVFFVKGSSLIPKPAASIKAFIYIVEWLSDEMVELFSMAINSRLKKSVK